ncbi:Kunitz/Bovine pancreatic trypsin inhibitor domain protein, partial [Ostertagia ostertagi]
ECVEFLFKGCGGNQNRFASKEDCLQGCKSLTLCGKGLPLMDFAGNIKRCEADRVPCPGSHECIGRGMESVCCQKADTTTMPRLNSVRSFTFTGCGGNENNFKTKGECTQFCSNEIICPRGDPHPDRYSINKIATCHEDKHCPRNYTCTPGSERKERAVQVKVASDSE